MRNTLLFLMLFVASGLLAQTKPTTSEGNAKPATAKPVVPDDQWQSVIVTRDPHQVKGMYNYGIVKATSSASSKHLKAAVESATIQLQKKGAALKAYIILVENERVTGPNRSAPVYVMEGIAYGLEPLEKGNNQKNDNQTKPATTPLPKK